MQSFSTKLDCDDCICLLPNGILILNLTPRTYERIPIQHKKESSKRCGLLKYGKFYCHIVIIIYNKNYFFSRNTNRFDKRERIKV
jgi:hypothetical protein